MTRGRSKSIVEKIASDPPAYSEDHLHLGKNAYPEALLNKRSSSVDELFKRNKDTAVNYSQEYTYPFNSSEESSLWTSYIDAFNHDCLLDPASILQINQQETDAFYNFQETCAVNISQVKDYIEETDKILKSVNSLMLKYDQISHETSDFDNESSKLLNDQTTYTSKYNQIETYLKHFENLESITRSLSRSGYHLVNQRREFFKNEILNKLDSSIDFFEEHPDFKDIESYKSRFRQCMTRALTLIKNFLIGEFKKLSESVNSKLSESKSESSTKVTIDLLIYNEFNNYLKSNHNQFNDLINEIKSRIKKHDEYQGLMNEVLTNYFQVRLELQQVYFSKNSYLQNLYANAITSKDLVQSCQDQISFFKRIIEREFVLFESFFGNGTGDKAESDASFIHQEFYQFSRNLLEPLYDSLRHIILRETNISNLCQLTTLLQKYYEFDEDVDDANSAYLSNSDISINFGELFEPVLHDVQTRLIFRIQNYVDAKLMRYIPKPEDLQLGRRRSRASRTRSSIKNTDIEQSTPDATQTEESTNNDAPVNSLDVDYPDNLFEDVYLPLGKALSLLSNVYELINSVVFDDLAHYIVHACIILLRGEFYKLSISHVGVIDTKLHYLKNLIILKGQINNFDIQSIRTDYSIDFTGGINEVWAILRNGDFSFNDNGLIELVRKSAPKIINNMIDANNEIEMELNNAVNDFIKECTNSISEPIKINDKSTLVNPLDRSVQFKDNLMMKIPNFYKQIKIFINDENIIKFLMDNLTTLVLTTYENFYRYLIENLDQIDEKVRQEQIDEVVEVDALFGFLNDLVTRLYEDDEREIEFNEDILKDLAVED